MGKTIVQRLHKLVDKLLHNRRLIVVLFALLSAWMVYQSIDALHWYYIVEAGQETKCIVSTEEDRDELLRREGYAFTPYDEVVERSSENGKIREITIRRAFPVYLTTAEGTAEFMVTGGKVEDILARADLTVRSQDELSIPRGAFLQEGDEIVLTRIDYIDSIEYEPIPYETQTRQTSLLATGRSYQLSPGEDGLLAIITRETYIDGQRTDTDTVEHRVIEPAVPEQMLVGAKVATSPLGGVALDENGNPVSYRQVYSGLATAYSMRPGAGTASGRSLTVGNIAVDPAKIPYGTQMYIKTEDGSFIYGTAVAADTGGALRQGIVDVDLLFETYEEALLFGKRRVVIYIL